MKILTVSAIIVITLLLCTFGYAYSLVQARETQKLDMIWNDIQAMDKTEMTGNPQKGKYVAFMGGCIACHTNTEDGGMLLAGGVPIATPFGTVYSPNITSDKDAGIGKWTKADFVKAMSAGVSPNDEHYYPVFPYTSYSTMGAQDLIDLKSWLDSVESVATSPPAHTIFWPFSIRSTLLIWKAMFFDTLREDKTDGRGSYLVNGPGHCAECHSQRNILGGLSSRALSGNSRGPDGESVPGITAVDLSDWTTEDLELFLEVGMTPTGDFTGGHMTDVIDYGTSQLTPDDRASIAQFLLSRDNIK